MHGSRKQAVPRQQYPSNGSMDEDGSYHLFYGGLGETLADRTLTVTFKLLQF